MVEQRKQILLIYHFCRLRLPEVALSLADFQTGVDRAYQRHTSLRSKEKTAGLSWGTFVESLHSLDCFVACACLKGLPRAWEALFHSRANRTDSLLVDALRSRAVRLFPRDPERQDELVSDFWGYLLAGQREGSLPILARYDGLRPLVPWLICVFHNKVLSELRKDRGEVALPDDDLSWDELKVPEESSQTHWHEHFREAAREWFGELNDQEVLLLGLRLRYRLSQRDVAKFLGIHEGNVTRKIDAISKKCHERISKSLRELGWTGDDLYDFIHKEMYALLLDEPRLSADRLAGLLAQMGRTLPP